MSHSCTLVDDTVAASIGLAAWTRIAVFVPTACALALGHNVVAPSPPEVPFEASCGAPANDAPISDPRSKLERPQARRLAETDIIAITARIVSSLPQMLPEEGKSI